MRKIRTYIFDLDGVIVDTAKYHYLAWKNSANQLGIEFTKESNELLKGVSRIRSLEIILELGNKKISDAEFDRILNEKNKNYLSYIEKMDASEILPGVLDALKWIKENDGKIALGSASKNAKPILEKVGLMEYFDAIVDGNDVSKAKPDPEVFLLGAEQTHSKPEECVVFEDAIAGIQAANNAGMLSIGIGEKEVLKEADYVFQNFTEIEIEFFEKLENN
ncbi:beta-phosphoglucomutase [Moheibacter sp.]|uniref:beta-phosphoglucomutase n=1 Tax=Moheibacter sp. TaxID=1965316 RepID=UPI003C74ABD8